MAEEGAVLPGALAAEAFFGRVRETQGLRREARSLLRGRGRSRALCALPGAGRTELLLHWHGRLFREGEILPLYWAVPRCADRSSMAADLAGQIAVQALAFARRDPGLLLRPPATQALAAALRSAFGGAGDVLAEALARGAVSDPRATLLLPHRFSLASGVPVLAMIDDAGHLAAAGDASPLPAGAAASASAPLLLVLEEESELAALLGPGSAALMSLGRLGPLSGEAVRQLARHLARIGGLQLGDAAVDALEREAAGSPFYLGAVMRALGEAGGAGPVDVCRAAASAVCDGEIARYWLERLKAHLPVRGARAAALEILAYCLRDPADAPEIGRLAASMLKTEDEVETALAGLQRAGVLHLDCARVEVREDPVFRDAALALYRREFEGCAAAAVTAACAAAKVRGAAAAVRARGEAAFREGLASLLRGWDGQQVPRELFDAPAFARGRRAGAPAAGRDEAPEVTLPRVISVVSGRVGAAGSPAGCDVDALAWGLRDEPGAKDADVAWVARRVAGGSGSAAQLSAFDRQVAALQAAGDLPSERLVRWALPDQPLDGEGEQAAAGLRLMTSTPAQLAALAEALGLPAPPSPAPLDAGPAPSLEMEMEMTIPRAADAELVAARALEQLAENLGMGPEDAGRLKTALVEACINAFEHSGDREGRVRLWFGVAGRTLRIRVENRGRPLAALPATAAAADGPRRRGWGLTLMRQLIDEVRIEPREDGVSLVLEKKLGGRSDG